MADGRFLSKSIAHDMELNTVSMAADYLFTRCIPHLDVEGRMLGHPAQVKAIAVPMREDMTVDTVAGALRELSGVGLVHLYETDGKTFLQFPSFERHQKGLRKSREAPSKIPPPKPVAAEQLRSNAGPNPEDSGENRVKCKGEVEVEVEGTTHTHHAHEALVSWLGKHSGCIDGMEHVTQLSLWGLYGPSGTDERVWGRIPPPERPPLLATAVMRWSSEGHVRFNARLFRAILTTVTGHGNTKATGTDGQPPRRRTPDVFIEG